MENLGIKRYLLETFIEITHSQKYFNLNANNRDII